MTNGIALCAIHHLAYDRNLLGIAPDGVVHIASRLLDEIDGPMLRVGLQGFHRARITQPRRRQDRPDPERLEIRFDRFGDTGIAFKSADSRDRYAPKRPDNGHRRAYPSCPRGPKTRSKPG